MTQIKLSEKDIQDLNEFTKNGIVDVCLYLRSLIEYLRKMNEDHEKFELSDLGLIKETISGSDLLMAVTQQGKIQLPLFVQLLQLLNNRNEPFEIIT